jgi:hypothetical protein
MAYNQTTAHLPPSPSRPHSSILGLQHDEYYSSEDDLPIADLGTRARVERKKMINAEEYQEQFDKLWCKVKHLKDDVSELETNKRSKAHMKYYEEKRERTMKST